MNLEFYKTFFYAAKHESISKAAEHLYITQPAVSRAIRQLEDNLGCSLFIRTSKGVKLTPEGQILYENIDKAFQFLFTAERKIDEYKNLLSGEVRIGVSDTLCKYYLVPYLKLFHTLHPAIKIHVVCPTTPVIIHLLKAGKIDFGLINMPYYDEQLVFRSIMEIQDCFAAGDKYRNLSAKMQPLSEIVKHPLLLLEQASNSRVYIDQYFLNHSIAVSPAFELGNMDLLVQFARFDLGIACVIRNFIEEELETGRLYEIKPIQPIPPREIGVTWRKDVPLSNASQNLISLLEFNDTSEI